MKMFRLLLPFLFVLVILQGCNTLYSTKVIDIEIVEPGKVKFPASYKKVAVRYNNCNIAPNPFYSQSQFNNEILTDTTNIDSFASKIYYDNFVYELRQQNFFDSVTEVEAYDYGNIKITDTINHVIDANFDSIVNFDQLSEELNVYLFSQHISQHPMEKSDISSIKYLNPKLGLYNKNELQNIADSTNADLLISLDYFSSLDGIFYKKTLGLAQEFVLSQGYWNFYDLNNQEYLFFYNRNDTVIWEEYSNPNKVSKVLPPQKDAVLNAADLSGTQYAQFLVPHWIQVQRMYYSSGHVDLKTTDQLVEDGKWMEAVEIWKANVNNPNKSISAKCQFNMGLACEMQGNLNAALEWVVQSFHVFGQKNMVHFQNCSEYIRILGQRKLDKKVLDKQFELVN